jgi:hypothetical protein
MKSSIARLIYASHCYYAYPSSTALHSSLWLIGALHQRSVAASLQPPPPARYPLLPCMNSRDMTTAFVTTMCARAVIRTVNYSNIQIIKLTVTVRRIFAILPKNLMWVLARNIKNNEGFSTFFDSHFLSNSAF